MAKAEAQLVCEDKGKDLIVGSRDDGTFFLVGSMYVPLDMEEVAAIKIAKFILNRTEKKR